MNKTDRIEARIESELKQAAEMQIPNAETLAAIEEVEKHSERLKRYNSVDKMFEDWDTSDCSRDLCTKVGS